MQIPKTTPIGETGKIVLADDLGGSASALRAGRLDWDDDFTGLPEVRALVPGQVVIDVGAFIGDTTHMFLLRGCEVYAFEPQSDAFFCLVHNCPEAHCYQAAVGSDELYQCSTGPEACERAQWHLGGRPLVRDGFHRTVALDRLGFSRVDFLKIDAEGWEPLVLAGAKDLIAKYKPVIHVEVFTAALAPLGFTAGSILGHLSQYNCREVRRYDANLHELICIPR